MSLLLSRLLTILIITAAATAVHAETPSSVFEVVYRGRIRFCGSFNNFWLPALKLTDGSYVSTRSELRLLTTRIRREKVSQTRLRLENRHRTTKTLQTQLRPVCSKGPTNTPGDGTGGTPTPTPTPNGTVPPLNPCFLRDGDIKAGCFGIPEQLTGNINRGESYYTRNCRGCHGVRSALTYSYVTATFDRVPQMQPFRPAMQDLADIVAYLNRFNF